jgi:hypothetical protein
LFLAVAHDADHAYPNAQATQVRRWSIRATIHHRSTGGAEANSGVWRIKEGEGRVRK